MGIAEAPPEMNGTGAPAVLSTREAARVTGGLISRESLRAAIEDGRLPAVLASEGKRQFAIHRADLEAFIQQLDVCKLDGCSKRGVTASGYCSHDHARKAGKPPTPDVRERRSMLEPRLRAGESPRALADELGLDPWTVTNDRRALRLPPRPVGQPARHPIPEPRECSEGAACLFGDGVQGRVFTPESRTAPGKQCSDECRLQALHRANTKYPRPGERECEGCGQRFTPPVDRASYGGGKLHDQRCYIEHGLVPAARERWRRGEIHAWVATMMWDRASASTRRHWGGRWSGLRGGRPQKIKQVDAETLAVIRECRERGWGRPAIVARIKELAEQEPPVLPRPLKDSEVRAVIEHIS